MIRIIIADDHRIMREGLISLISSSKDIKIVGTAANGHEVLQLLRGHEVDIVVLDIEMPEMDGIETTLKIKSRFPNTKVLILTMHGAATFIRKIIKAGANGYILKNKGKEELIFAINEIYQGQDYFGKDITKIIVESMKTDNVVTEIRLTKREMEVLCLIANGKTTPQISECLFIAASTVETHRRNLIEKTGVDNSKGLVKFAIERGYI